METLTTTAYSHMARNFLYLDLTTTWILFDSGLLQSTRIFLSLDPSSPWEDVFWKIKFEKKELYSGQYFFRAPSFVFLLPLLSPPFPSQSPIEFVFSFFLDPSRNPVAYSRQFSAWLWPKIDSIFAWLYFLKLHRPDPPQPAFSPVSVHKRWLRRVSSGWLHSSHTRGRDSETLLYRQSP